MQKKKKNILSGNYKSELAKRVKDYGNESFFVQKAEASKKIMEKYSLPKELIAGKK